VRERPPKPVRLMNELDGLWEVKRTGGLLPPLVGVRKHISGPRGETRIGSLPGLPFHVIGRELRYRGPFAGFVDVVEPDEEGFNGRATFLGRTFGQFALRRAP
jgi:hypothetical protein